MARRPPVILTVLGGSAHSTPVLVRSLDNGFADESVVVRLVGRDTGRLRAVGRACRLIADRGHVVVEDYAWPESPEAVRGADAVLVQIRPGGYDGRAFDETFPLRYGVPGDEGLGPGGLAAAWRGWPIVRDILGAIRRRNPAATIVLLTSPGSLLVRLAGAGVIGVCELPWTTLCAICGDAERALGASFEYHGVNHIGWLYNVRVDGREMPDRSGMAFPSDVVRRLRAWPLKYLRLHYHADDVVAEQRRAPAARVWQLVAIAKRSFDIFARGNRMDIERALCARRAEWYPDAVVPLLRAIRGRRVATPLFLTRAGEGEVQERCYHAADGRLEVREPSEPPPSEVAETVARFMRYERIAASAVEQRSLDLAVDALSLHPWIRSRTQAARLARRVVTQT
jgi:6-phospho-beta-glucosidase